MERSIRECKKLAKMSLRGNYLIPIVGTITSSGLSLLGSSLTSALFPGEGTVSMILGEVFYFILSLLVCVFSAGLYRIYLCIARGETYSMGDLLYFFRNRPDCVIVASFVLSVISLITSLPCMIFGYASEVGDTAEEQMVWMVTYFALLLLGSLLNFLVTIPFALTYFLLADEENLGGMDALKKSAQMMKGRIWKFILLNLSFVPWLILSIFTLYLALLWVIPYMEMSITEFYLGIRQSLYGEEPRTDYRNAYPDMYDTGDTRRLP
ncbi:MAG: DUF975 family protein [Clostridiales bacterium]|nr:DUF975 family protein [Clostridiales bacterium]